MINRYLTQFDISLIKSQTNRKGFSTCTAKMKLRSKGRIRLGFRENCLVKYYVTKSLIFISAGPLTEFAVVFTFCFIKAKDCECNLFINNVLQQEKKYFFTLV